MKEFRDRVLIPLSIPVISLAVIAVVVLNISRMLIALEERNSANFATAMAIVVGSVVLGVFTYISAVGEQRSKNNAAVLAMSGVLVLFGGLVGYEAIREKEEAEHAEAAHGEITGPADVTIDAIDIGFTQKEAQAAAKPDGIIIEYVNAGSQAHTLLFEEFPQFPKLEVTSKGATDKGVAKLTPGSYTYFCDIPGHRAAGMEGKLTVAEGGAAPATEGAPEPAGGESHTESGGH